VAKSLYALQLTGLNQLVVAGGVGANRRLRQRLDREAAEQGYSVFYPEFEFCTDNGAMIALAGALRLGAGIPNNPSGAIRRDGGIGAHAPEALRMQRAGSPTQDTAARTYAFTVKPRWELSTMVS
jgi:tRNA N6-adenosine threonylcarbamoyltransferase